MELKDFVKSVLKDVVDAVEESSSTSIRNMYLKGLDRERTVEFDIAVAAENSSTGEVKAGVKVFSLVEGGGNLSEEFKNSTVSRIRFGVHIEHKTKQEMNNFKNQLAANKQGVNVFR